MQQFGASSVFQAPPQPFAPSDENINGYANGVSSGWNGAHRANSETGSDERQVLFRNILHQRAVTIDIFNDLASFDFLTQFHCREGLVEDMPALSKITVRRWLTRNKKDVHTMLKSG